MERPHTLAARGRLTHRLFASDRNRGLERSEPPVVLERQSFEAASARPLARQSRGRPNKDAPVPIHNF
jgi:hypothetical protein